MFNIAETIENAKQGDVIAARKILELFYEEMDNSLDSNGKLYRVFSSDGVSVIERLPQIDVRILVYLSDCFKQILSDAPGVRTDANHALNIVKAGARGRKKTKEGRQNSLIIGYEVMERHKKIKAECKKNALRGGKSPLEIAIEDIARERRKSIQTIKDAYDEFNKLVNDAYDEFNKLGNEAIKTTEQG